MDLQLMIYPVLCIIFSPMQWQLKTGINTRHSADLILKMGNTFWVHVKVSTFILISFSSQSFLEIDHVWFTDRMLRLYRTSGKSFTLLRKIAARDVGWSILDTAFSPDGTCCVYSSWSDSSKHWYSNILEPFAPSLMQYLPLLLIVYSVLQYIMSNCLVILNPKMPCN